MIFNPVFRAFLQNPLYPLLGIVGVGLVVASLATLFRSPGTSFVLSVDVTGFDLRIGATPAIIRDIQADTITIDGQSDFDQDYSNSPDTTEAHRDKKQMRLSADPGTVAKIDTLNLPAFSLVSARYYESDDLLTLNVEAPAGVAKAEALIVGTYKPRADDALKTVSELVAAERLSLQIEGAAPGSVPTRPFTIKNLQLSTRLGDPAASYPVSLISAGRLQFYVMGTALPELVLDEGESLQMTGLQAEIGAVGIGDSGLKLRVLGTASDIARGYGSSLVSVFPNAFEGIGAQPVLRVAFGTVVGVIFALIGAASVGSSVRNGDGR